MSENQMIRYGKYGWVDLSNLIKNKSTICWKESVGKTIEFQYDDICSTILISGYYDKKRVYIDINGYVSNYLVYTTTITSVGLGGVLNHRYLNNFKYNIGDVVNGNMLIVGRYRDDKHVKKYDFKCLIDGYCGSKKELDLIHGVHCPVCLGVATSSGYNDIATTHPHFVKYFKNPDDAKKYSICSGKSTWFRCPICGSVKYTQICCAFQNGYHCPSCGDNVSYCNKFVYCFLTQLKQERDIDIYSEKSFDWSRNLKGKYLNKIYDFYVTYNDYKIIIEVHGEQHYRGGFEYCGGKTLQEEQENDLFKYNLALQNGFNDDSYIVLDGKKSRRDYIKKSIMNSRLPDVFCFLENEIDWNKCEEYACDNLIKTACDLWNSGIHNASAIARQIGRASCTVSIYLRKGHDIGWIEYEPKDKMPLICLENNYVFSYSTICSNYSEELLGVFINKKCIINNLCGDSKSTHGFHFQHITRKEFNQIKQTEPWRVFE